MARDSIVDEVWRAREDLAAPTLVGNASRTARAARQVGWADGSAFTRTDFSGAGTCIGRLTAEEVYVKAEFGLPSILRINSTPLRVASVKLASI
jgi:hypothetical protein